MSFRNKFVYDVRGITLQASYARVAHEHYLMCSSDVTENLDGEDILQPFATDQHSIKCADAINPFP